MSHYGLTLRTLTKIVIFMLGLKLPTDPRWANIAEKNIEEILTDHAFCEQKAASYAISLLVGYSELPDLVSAMADLAQEEMDHFKQVHNHILRRNLELGRERKDEYVHQIAAFFPHHGNRMHRLVQKLLIAALIEARSCERFKVLSENLTDPELAAFYRELMISEATHYTLFLKFARQYGNRAVVDAQWQALLQHEAAVMKNLGTKELIHG